MRTVLISEYNIRNGLGIIGYGIGKELEKNRKRADTEPEKNS